MKKAFFTLALTLVAFTSNAQTSPRGDLNGDGIVSISDVMELVSIVLYGDGCPTSLPYLPRQQSPPHD